MRNWEDSILRMLLPDPPLVCVVRLQLDRTFKKEKDRVEKFIAETGRSRPTYSRLKRLVKA
jgi:hypothetical protein